MQYPEKMIQFKPEIAELSQYLTELKQLDELSKIDNKHVGGIFSKITAKIDSAENNVELAQDIADTFLLNLNNLYNEIGNKIAVENEAMLATMVQFTFMAVLSTIAQAERNATWN